MLNQLQHLKTTLSSVKDSELFPHAVGVLVGVTLGLMGGGYISEQADKAEALLPPQEENTDGTTTTELSE